MTHARNVLPVIVFFCLMGWVCNTSAFGQSKAKDAKSAAADKAVGSDATSLFTPDESADTKGDEGVKVGTFGQIDLHVKDLELTKVLQLLSIQSQRNIVASRNVAGTVSADLYGVDFYEAMAAILHPNGFGFKEKGQFIFVYTAEELRQIEQADRKVVTKVVRLSFMNAADASTFLRPMLSEAGAIAINGETKAGFQPTISDGGEDSYAHAATLLIRDYPENITEMSEVLKQLDVKPKQVLVEATVLQARLSETNRFGVDVSVLANFDFAQFMNPASVVNELVAGAVKDPGQAIRTNPGQVGKGDSTFQIGIVDKQFSVFIEALDKVTDTTVLANPKLLVLNRQKSDLLVGERLGYLSTSATETSTTQTVEFLDIGVQLTVRPFVSDDDSIRLEMRPSVSDGETVLSNGLVIPNQRTQEMVTNVIVKSGQTIVLGGLFKEDTTVSRRQVPGVASLPIVGGAFKGQDDSAERSEVIFMVKPTVVHDKALYAAGDHANQSVEYATMGSREGLLPWSKQKLTTSHLRDAQTHFENGDTEKALWSVNMALRLNPDQPNARRLKDQITGEHRKPVSNSMLEGAIDALIAAQPTGKKKGADAAPESNDKEAIAPVNGEQHAEVDTTITPETTVTPVADRPGSQIDETPALPAPPAPLTPPTNDGDGQGIAPDNGGDDAASTDTTAPAEESNIEPAPTPSDDEASPAPQDSADDTPGDAPGQAIGDSPEADDSATE